MMPKATAASLTMVESRANWTDRWCLPELSTMSRPSLPSESVLVLLIPYVVLV